MNFCRTAARILRLKRSEGKTDLMKEMNKFKMGSKCRSDGHYGHRNECE